MIERFGLVCGSSWLLTQLCLYVISISRSINASFISLARIFLGLTRLIICRSSSVIVLIPLAKVQSL